MSKIQLTVFTPTYNRAYCLHECYNSLRKQNNKNFIWLIVDDGSTDDTKRIVEKWKQKDNGFEIVYIYKENGGMHTAYNTAYRYINTELSMNVDSDDHLADDAINTVLNFWNKSKRDDVGGIIALDVTKNGEVIGEKFPDDLTEFTGWGNEYIFYKDKNGKKRKFRVTGDKKFIGVTKAINRYPEIPVFEGEKYYSLYHKQYLVEKDYNILILNEPVCVVDYRTDSNSNQMFSQYTKCPNGFCDLRKRVMKDAPIFRLRFKAAVHYVCESKLAGNKRYLSDSPKKLLTLAAVPLGKMLYYKVLKETCK